MNLKEQLKNLPHDKPIKVGCSDGSSYFYVGTVEDMLANMDEYANGLDCASVESVNRARESYRRAANAKIYPMDFCMSLIDKVSAEFSVDAYVKYLEKYFKNIEHMKCAYDVAKARRDKFVQLPEREVIDCFECDSVADEGVTAIITEGTEYGRFWCTTESHGPCMRLMNASYEE